MLSPNELIQAMLRAPVDLLWNGGIGTYVKASSEANGEAGDKANDPVRIDGDELRCKVVGEGGNLGFTQRARIEYALAGGKINTDAIDNVAGVNTSDHEVNIKILLGALVANGDMTFKQRNVLLTEMTDAVADQVLYGSYTQTQAMSLALVQAAPMVDVHARLIHNLEQVAGLDRGLEFLPSDEEISDRKAAHQGLVSPELAVMMAYCKIHLYAQLLESDLPEDPYLAHDLERYFPPPLPERYSHEMRSHRLSREIIATVVANQLVDRAGTTFAFRLGEETGAPPSILARAYAVAREVFDMRSFWGEVEALDNQVDPKSQLAMLIEGRRLVERATRWLVRANPRAIDIEQAIERFEPGAKRMAQALPDVLDGGDREAFDKRVEDLRNGGVPAELADRAAGMPSLYSVFDIVEVAASSGRDQDMVMTVYAGLGSRVGLNWLRDRIIELPRTNRWQALARAALREDLYGVHRSLAQEVIEAAGAQADGEEAIDAWVERNEVAVERCMAILADINASRAYDTTTLPVALREVRNLIHADGGVGGDGLRSQRARPGRVRRRSRQDQGGHEPSESSGPRQDQGQPTEVRPLLTRPTARDHSDAVTNTSTSTTPATRKASGPVTTRPASRESTAPSYRPVNMNSVKTSVTELPESRVRVQAEVPAEEVERRIQQAARELGRQMRIPGFRKGKVPPPVVIRRLGREAVLDEALRSALGRWYVDAIDEAGISPIGEPDLDVGDLPEEGQPLAFSIEIGVRPKAKLGQYKGLEVGRREPEVDDALIDQEIDGLRDRFATLETVERPAESGDHVVVDYIGRVDGEAFEGGEGRDQLIELGSGRLVPGFEEQLIGATAGDKRDVEVTFPDEYPGGLGGKTAVFEVTVSEVKAKRLPELDDEFAADAGGFDTVAELREDVAARLKEAEERTIEREFEQAVIDAAVAEAEVELPDKLVHAQAHELLEQTLSTLARRGISKDAYLRIAGKDEETLAHEAEPDAAVALRREAVLAEVVEAEQIDPTEEQVLEMIAPAAEREGIEPEKLLEQLREGGRLERVRDDVATSLAVDLLVKEATPISVEQAKARQKLWTPGQEGKQQGSGSGQLWTPGS